MPTMGTTEVRGGFAGAAGPLSGIRKRGVKSRQQMRVTRLATQTLPPPPAVRTPRLPRSSGRPEVAPGSASPRKRGSSGRTARPTAGCSTGCTHCTCAGAPGRPLGPSRRSCKLAPRPSALAAPAARPARRTRCSRGCIARTDEAGRATRRSRVGMCSRPMVDTRAAARRSTPGRAKKQRHTTCPLLCGGGQTGWSRGPASEPRLSAPCPKAQSPLCRWIE